VLGYYGGDKGVGADYAGWYSDENGQASGFGQHPPGSSFKVYDLAAAVREKISVKEHFDSPDTKEFPASGRTKGSPAGPIRNAEHAPCQPDCALWEATVGSLNVTYFGLTERLGTAKVIDMATRAGVDSMWANEKGNPKPKRIELRGRPGTETARHFSTEAGIGQYGITVQDNANGMATFAAGGKRADAHFVRSVTKGDEKIFEERLVQTGVGLDQEAVNQLDWTLSRVRAAELGNGWDSAGKTGTWQAGQSLTQNVHTWMVGYTGALAAAVWLGTNDGKPLRTKDGSYDVFGATGPAPIWRQFMEQATAALKLDPDKYRFGTPKFPEEARWSTDRATPNPAVTQPPPTTAQPSPTVTQPTPTTAQPTPTTTRPTCDPAPCVTSSPTPTRNPPLRPSPLRTSTRPAAG